jgi:hypothetical protein
MRFLSKSHRAHQSIKNRVWTFHVPDASESTT